MTHVLVIDDDQDIARLLTIRLARAGFDVDSRSDGASGLSAIHANHPEVAVVDWMMPGMDGIELARAVRAAIDIHDTKLLMLTARSNPADHALARATGYDDVLTKPFVPADLVSRVQTLCDASHGPAS
ncbi:response regulator transcription factor [Microbacterium sp. 18062]|uniref:response regulator transcription factor n=1 Tax=Microbacterium sp. 18062 TaxID=2681410 RepID=UPI0013572939|nr:response regulator [Microbacterium sp. 18062]